MWPSTSLVVLALIAFASAAKPLKSWKICKRSDPKMNDCLRGAVESAVKGLKDGNPKLGVIPLDPLHFNQLEIAQSTGPVAIVLDFYHINIEGIRGLNIDSFKADWDKYHLETEIHLEDPHQLMTTGKYNVSGKILMLPIQGAGPCNLTMEDFKAKIIFDGHEVEKAGEKYAQFDKVKVLIETTKMHIRLENLFNGDKALGEQMNVFLNENWQQILEELKPSISKAIGAAFTAVTNAVFSKIPISAIAPP